MSAPVPAESVPAESALTGATPMSSTQTPPETAAVTESRPSDPPTEPPLRDGSGRWLTRAAAVLLLVGAGIGIGVYGRSGGKPEPELAPAAPGAMPVEVVTLAREDVPFELRFLGQTGPSHVVELRSQVSGTLTRRSFSEGASVTSGQILLQVDPRPFQLQLGETQARLRAAEASAEQARLEFVRYQALRQKQAATQGEVEEREKIARVAEAEVELQKAQAESIRLQLDYASIEAPSAGVIGEALADTGTYVDPSSVLAVIQQVDPLYVRYFVSEQDLLRFQRLRANHEVTRSEPTDLELEITLADGRVHPQRGRLDFVDTGLSQSTGTAAVRGVIPNPDHSLRPGQFVHVRILGLERLQVLRVPHAAVRHAPSGATVFVVGAESKVEVRRVELGEWLGVGQWEIRAGLEPGERVIVNRIMTLRPGVPVSPSEASATPEASAPAPERGAPAASGGEQ